LLFQRPAPAGLRLMEDVVVLDPRLFAQQQADRSLSHLLSDPILGNRRALCVCVEDIFDCGQVRAAGTQEVHDRVEREPGHVASLDLAHVGLPGWPRSAHARRHVGLGQARFQTELPEPRPHFLRK